PVSDIRDLLDKGRIGDASKWLLDYGPSLTPADQRMASDDLKQKQEVRRLLSKVEGLVAAKQYMTALDALDSAEKTEVPRFDFSADRKERDRLADGAKAAERARLVSAADTALRGKDKKQLAVAVDNVRAFRDRYPEDRWMPDLGRYKIMVDVRAVIDRAWTAY